MLLDAHPVSGLAHHYIRQCMYAQTLCTVQADEYNAALTGGHAQTSDQQMHLMSMCKVLHPDCCSGVDALYSDQGKIAALQLCQ